MGLIVFITLMGFTLGPRASLSWPEKFVKDTVGFIQYVFYKPAGYVAGLFEDIGNLRSLQEENKELKIALAHYTRDKARFNTLEQENIRFKDDLKFTQTQKEKYNYEYRIGQVSSVNNDPINRTLVIDRGSHDGVKVDMAVTSAEGLVGIVSQVSSFSSTVKLLTSMDAKDPNSKAIAATVQGNENNTFGIVESYDMETNTFLMTKLEDSDPLNPLKEGDIIISSGIGGVFPKFMVIGTVKSRQPGEFGLTDTATIEPAANFADWKELFVVFTPEVKE